MVRTLAIAAGTFIAGIAATLLVLQVLGTFSHPASVRPAASPPKPHLLDRIFSYDILGVTVAYLERLTGPAKYVGADGSRSYEIEGCQVTFRSDGKSVSSIAMSLDEHCSFDASRFLGPGMPQANRLTFGDIWRMGPTTKFLADCLDLCGNAHDPDVFLYRQGSHAELYLQVTVGAPIVSDALIKAMDDLVDAMKKEKGEAYVVNKKFNCDTTFDARAAQALKDIRIETIEIGADTKPAETDCGKPQ